MPDMPSTDTENTAAEAIKAIEPDGARKPQHTRAPQHTPKHSDPDALAQTQTQTQTQAQARKKRSVVLLSIVLAVLLCGVGVGVGYLAWQQYQLDRAAQEARETPPPVVEDSGNETEPTSETEPAPETEPLVENPIDFSALKLENQDIYGWIHIPNTEVNHPILRHLKDDNYYLTHNRNNQISAEGALYSQSINSTDFSDPVTLIYGHNMINNGMFATLHYFENTEFFAANDCFYIYTPGHILTYRIISAYLYDDRHIMNSFDFSNPQTLQNYLSFVQNPDALIANTRAGTELSNDDKIVQLSTCMSDPAYSSSRYLVSGALVDDKLTY
jgi:sortase B